MWIERSRYNHLVSELDHARRRNEALIEAARRLEQRANERVVDMTRTIQELTERLVTLASRPPTIVQPPDTTAIVRETIDGVATVLNGWRTNPDSQQYSPSLQMDQQGLGADAGTREDLAEFIPPWERLGQPMPEHGVMTAGPPSNGYAPYVPGAGNTAPPRGGIE